MSMSAKEIWWDTLNHMISNGIFNDEDELAVTEHIDNYVTGLEMENKRLNGIIVERQKYWDSQEPLMVDLAVQRDQIKTRCVALEKEVFAAYVEAFDQNTGRNIDADFLEDIKTMFERYKKDRPVLKGE